MFANALRSQARLGLRTAVRTAVPATRTLTLAGTRVVAAPTSSLAKLVLSSRAFSQSAPTTFESTNQYLAEESETIFVGNLPWSATRDEITELFSEFGPVVNVRIQTHMDGRPRGFAHITFGNVKDSVSAVVSATEEPIHLGGRDLVVNYARSKTESQRNLEPSEKIYFSGCRGGEVALRNVLRDIEEDVRDIHFLRDGNTGEQLPTGFLEFRSIESATNALKRFDGHEMEGGLKLFLNYARPKKTRQEGGSNYGNRNRNDRNREPFRSRMYRPQKDY